MEESANQEYEDYMILDFAKEPKEIRDNFARNIGDLDILIPSEEERFIIYTPNLKRENHAYSCTVFCGLTGRKSFWVQARAGFFAIWF